MRVGAGGCGGCGLWVGGVGRSKLRAEGRLGLAGLTGARSLLEKFGADRGGRAKVETAMGADVVVFVAEGAGDHLRLQRAVQQLAIEAFVAEAAVEAFVDAVLPGTAGFDEPCYDAALFGVTPVWWTGSAADPKSNPLPCHRPNQPTPKSINAR